MKIIVDYSCYTRIMLKDRSKRKRGKTTEDCHITQRNTIFPFTFGTLRDPYKSTDTVSSIKRECEILEFPPSFARE